jgi:hypothetical protein
MHRGIFAFGVLCRLAKGFSLPLVKELFEKRVEWSGTSDEYLFQ